MREVDCSAAVAAKAVSEFVAFDQDPESLEVVARDYMPLGVRTVHGSVLEIIRKRVTFTGFDLVYAAGLFDYLSDALGRRLLAQMSGMVRPGGRVLAANFTPNNHGREYMECFMDWKLICRDADGMLDLLNGVGSKQTLNPRVYHDEFNNIVYLEFERG